MKKSAILKIAIVILASSTAILSIGCGEKNKGGGATAMQCDAYGNCYPTGGNYNPYNPYQPNPNEVILAGLMTIQDRSTWYDAMESFGLCATRDMCGLLPTSNPSVRITINDYKFSGTDGISAGSATIGDANFSRMFPVTWRMIDGNTAFEAQFQVNNGYKGRVMRVKSVGRPTDSMLYTELSLDGDLFAAGNVNRVNRPTTTPTPKPTPYSTRPTSYPIQQYPRYY